MSLRNDFEKDYRLDWEANDPAWCAYQAATERAVRIVEEELAARPKYFRAVEAIDRVLKRLKDES